MTASTSRFENGQLALDDIDLQPPIAKIARSGLAKLRVSQYYFDEPLFDEYEATTVRATWDFAAAESIVEDGDEVLDLGCGDGRLLLHLTKQRSLGRSVGIDISEIAINRFQAEVERIGACEVETRLGDIFALPDDIRARRYDVVTFGDATVNFVLDDDKLKDLLTTARNQLRDETSRVMIAVFADGTPEQLAFMDNRCTVVPFRQASGRASLIWWAYKYDSERLIMHRSAFVQYGWDDEGDIEGVVCDLRDRMWTPSTIIPIAAAAGLHLERIVNSSVQDGAAVGMGTAVMILRRS
ncbi:MAG: class I SAM-dependent methyltransferase [Bowdeniella nasicola]|nr:class I SAM-dependent methyltransferase [Bowdeniella nasicola]